MRTAILATLLLTSSLLAQQRQVIRVGGGGEVPADWPKPEIGARTEAEMIRAIGDYAQKLADGDHFSGVLLIAKDGEPVVQRAWGMANDTEKITIDTKFNIGSINKVFTKKAIEQLAAAGKLSLDDTVRKHLPDFPSPVADRITIRHLLEHRSGLGDFFGPKYQSAQPSSLRELSDFVPLFADKPLEFEPGASQRYSNAGFIVLGLIVERVSGQKYRDYVSKNIFAPAGMKNSGFWAVDENVANRATGYTKRGPTGPLTKRTTNRATLPGRPSSAGGAFSTAPDLLRYVLWSKAAGIGAAGGAPGVNAILESDGGWTVIALSNFDPPSAEALGSGAMQIVRGKPEETIVRRGPSPPDEIDINGPVAVPLSSMEHLVTVEAKVNGKGPYRFVFDTGAGGNMRVSPELAKALELPEVGEAMAGDPSGKNLRRVPRVRVESVEIGGARFGGIDASIGGRLGPMQPDGVIGLGLFGELTVTIDYPKKELRISMDRLSADGAHVIPFTRPRGVPEIAVTAGGVAFKADVDSGSPSLISVPTSFGVPLTGDTRVVGRGRTSTNEFEIRAGELRGDLVIAGWTQAAPTIDIVDHFPVANIGSRFLRQYAVTFDLQNLRMRIGA